MLVRAQCSLSNSLLLARDFSKCASTARRAAQQRCHASSWRCHPLDGCFDINLLRARAMAEVLRGGWVPAARGLVRGMLLRGVCTSGDEKMREGGISSSEVLRSHVSTRSCFVFPKSSEAGCRIVQQALQFMSGYSRQSAKPL